MESLLLFLAAFVSSLVGGMLGMAGGIFIVPMLTLFFGINIHTAIGISLISVIACSCSGAITFLKNRLTNIRLAIVLETASTLGALTGVFLIGMVSTSLLYGLFAFILLLSAKQMMGQRQETITEENTRSGGWASSLDLHSRYPDAVSGKEIPYQVGHVPFGLVLMYGAGLVSALLGIGSGVLKIPAMDTALHLPLKVSSATSNFMIGVTAAASASAYFMRGDIDIRSAGPVALGSVIGALAGARLLVRFPANRLRMILVIILAALACQMFFTALGIDLFNWNQT